MPEEGLLLAKLDMRYVSISRTLERLGDFALLPRWKQDIACDTKHKGRRIGERLQAGYQIFGWFVQLRQSCTSLARDNLWCWLFLFLVRLIRKCEGASVSTGVLCNGISINEGLEFATIFLPQLVYAVAVLLAQIEQVHRLGNIEKAVGVVLQTPLLSGVVQICLDKEVRT